MGSLGKRYSHNNLLANLSFGFWRYQFASREFQAMGSTLHTIFPNRPKGTNHTVLFQHLTLINSLRNRIAHHEPICFSRQYEQISYIISQVICNKCSNCFTGLTSRQVLFFRVLAIHLFRRWSDEKPLRIIKDHAKLYLLCKVLLIGKENHF